MHRKGFEWLYGELNTPNFKKALENKYKHYEVRGGVEVGLGRGFEGLLMLSLMLILWTFILYVKHFKEKVTVMTQYSWLPNLLFPLLF